MFASLAARKLFVLCVVSLLTVAVTGAPAGAVIIRGGDGSGNTTAPADDPGWANVGGRSGSSAVYITNQWVLTAAHVGGGTVNFGGTNYSMVAGTWHRLHEPGNPSANVDLGLFQITAVPAGVSDLAISSSAPANGSDVVGIGYGRNRDSSDTWWDNTWQEQVEPEAYRGFKYDTGNTKRWGKNDIDNSGYTVNVGYGNTYTLEMDFDQSLGHGLDEMQAVHGDSGGAVSYKNGASWELSGIWMTRGTYLGQPTETAVYGNNSHAADLSQYRDQIMDIVPEPSTMLLMALAAGALAIRRRRP